MLWLSVLLVIALIVFAFFCGAYLFWGDKAYYSVTAEEDNSGVKIFKLHIVKNTGARQYIGKFDTLEAAKKKIVSLKKRSMIDAKENLAIIRDTELYREEM